MEIKNKMQKKYNSNKIIKAIRGNKQKFDTLKKLSEDILMVRNDKEKQKNFIKKSYSIVLRNLSNQKKEIVINDNDNIIYSISKTGISKKSSYGRLAENITKHDFLQSLVEVKKNLPVFLKNISLNKQTILKKFMEKVILLEMKKPVSIPMGIKIDWITGEKYIGELKINYDYRNIKIILGQNNWGSEKIDTINSDFKDYVIIEQIYNQIKKVLEMELKQNIKELNNIKKFLIDIDKKFSTYIQSVETLTELRK